LFFRRWHHKWGRFLAIFGSGYLALGATVRWEYFVQAFIGS